MSREFGLFCTQMEIKYELTTPYSPQQNGIVERKNRVLVEKARSMLSVCKLPNEFLVESILTAVYLSNVSLTQNAHNLYKKIVKGIFVGYCRNAKSYKIFVPTSRKNHCE